MLIRHPIEKRLRINHFIRALQLRLIDEQNQQVGVVSLEDALRLAQDRGLDLIEVSPLANPPVCRIADYGKYQYLQERQGRLNRAKQKKVGVKGIRLSLKIGEHDLAVRRGQAVRFLNEGHKVKIEIILRGRENSRKDLAEQKVKEFITSLDRGVKIEQGMTRMGNRLAMLIG